MARQEKPSLYKKLSPFFLKPGCRPLFLFAPLFVYLVIRSVRIPLTQDEAVTFLLFAQNTVQQIIENQLHHSGANNHLLNTLLIKLFTRFWGAQPLIIRLPALLGFALYFHGIYRISKKFLAEPSRTMTVLFLTCHPFLLDFFCCARGYSLALGFMAQGTYHLLKRFTGSQQKNVSWDLPAASCFFTLSVLSVLSFLNIFAGFAGVSILFILLENTKFLGPVEKRGKKSVLRELGSLAIGTGVLLALYLKPIQYLSAKNAFFYGGENGFWKDTVGSLINVSLYGKSWVPEMIPGVLQALIILSLLTAVYLLGQKIFRRITFSSNDRALLIAFALLVSAAIVNVALHVVRGIRFPLDRTGIQFIPLFFLFLIFLVKVITCQLKPAVWVRLSKPLGILFIAVLLFFFSCFNQSYFLIFKDDADTGRLMDALFALNDPRITQNQLLTIGTNWIFIPAISYQIYTHQLKWLTVNVEQHPELACDYYYLLPPDLEMVREQKLKILKKFALSSSLLAVPNDQPTETERFVNLLKILTLYRQEEQTGETIR